MSKKDVDEQATRLKALEIEKKDDEINQAVPVSQSAQPEIQQPQISQPKAPKRATTAFTLFLEFYRDSIRKTGQAVPDIDELFEECADQWNEMCEEEKEPFLEEAARDRERYLKEKEAFEQAHNISRPKMPPSAFALFQVDFRKELGASELEDVAIALLAAKSWKALTDEEKRPYIKQQIELKEVYEKQMEEYNRMMRGGDDSY